MSGSKLYVAPVSVSYRKAAARPRASALASEIHVAEVAGQLAWAIAKSGLLDTSGQVSQGVGDVVVATSPVMASLGTEVPLESLRPPREADMIRSNSTDSRSQILSFIPFGLLFLAISLRGTEQAEIHLEEEEDECDIWESAGLAPPERCRPALAPKNYGPVVAMASLNGKGGIFDA